jgi:hypothetical protein
MDVQKDFADLCSLWNAQGVEFPIIGGYAVAYHGAPRFTGDLDIPIRPEVQQVGRMLAKGFALEIPAGFGSQKSRKSRKSEVRPDQWLSGKS